jgi:hypothetical protein
MNTDTVGFLPTHDAGKTKINGRPRQSPNDYHARAERQQLRRLDEGPADAEILGYALERWTAYPLAQDGKFDFHAWMRSSILRGHFWTERLGLFQSGLWELVEGRQVIYDP